MILLVVNTSNFSSLAQNRLCDTFRGYQSSRRVDASSASLLPEQYNRCYQSVRGKKKKRNILHECF